MYKWYWNVLILLGTALLLAILLSMAGCASVPQVSVFDSFCQAYHRVILTTQDGIDLSFAPRAVKERIAANDTLYRCRCENWKNAICEKQ